MKKIFLLLALFFALINSAFAHYPNTCVQHMDEHFPFGNNFLYLGRCAIVDEDIPEIVAYVKNHPQVTGIFLGYNDIGPDGAAVLAQIPKLDELDIEGNSIQDEGAIALSHMVIKFLDVSEDRGYISSKGIIALVNNPAIETLNISGGVTRTNVDADEALAKNTTLKTLIMNDAYVSDKDIAIISTNKSIQDLDLEGNNIGPDGAAALAKNSTITRLDLIKNHIGDKGAIALANDANLTTLYIAQNDLGDEAAIALAKHSAITLLHLGYNHITDQGAMALANNNILTVLFIDSNHIGSKGINALDGNQHFELLDTSGNDGNPIGKKISLNLVRAYCAKKHIKSLCELRKF